MEQDTIIINPKSSVTHAIIWLHGLGADGSDFVPLIPQLALPQDHSIRFIFPHAPVRPVTINNGFEMPAWFDIISLERTEKQDEQGIKQTQQTIEALIQEQLDQGIPSNNIFLAGFSQGGAMALYTALRYDKPLAGIVALSTYLPLADALDNEANAANKATPIFMAHGNFDNVVLPEWGTRTKQRLQKNGYQLQWHDYDMDHSVCQQEISDLASWLQERL